MDHDQKLGTKHKFDIIQKEKYSKFTTPLNGALNTLIFSFKSYLCWKKNSILLSKRGLLKKDVE